MQGASGNSPLYSGCGEDIPLSGGDLMDARLQNPALSRKAPYEKEVTRWKN